LDEARIIAGLGVRLHDERVRDGGKKHEGDRSRQGCGVSEYR
jgi:hypothetical protein